MTSLHYHERLGLLAAGDSHGQVSLHDCRGEAPRRLSLFTSHTVSFDTDTIQHESDSIVGVETLYALPNYYSLLIANEKVVKLWTVSPTSGATRCRRKFQGGHEFRIHSISVSPSAQHFLTCDDLTLNLWDMERTDTTYRAADHKPRSVKDLREVLLFACFHHSDTSVLLTTSTSGTIRIGDLRVRAKMNPPAIELRRPKLKDSQYSDILCCVTGAAFGREGSLLYSRDFQTVFVWDLRQAMKPLASVKLNTDSRSLIDALNSPTGLVKFEIRAIPQGCVTGGFEGQINGISSNDYHRVETTSLPSTSLPHLVWGPSGSYAATGDSILRLRHWPHLDT